MSSFGRKRTQLHTQPAASLEVFVLDCLLLEDQDAHTV